MTSAEPPDTATISRGHDWGRRRISAILLIDNSMSYDVNVVATRASMCLCPGPLSSHCERHTVAARDCYPFVRVPLYSLPPDCWMASGRPPTGDMRRRCKIDTPMCMSTQMCSMLTRV